MTRLQLRRVAQVLAGQSPPSDQVFPMDDHPGRLPFLQGNAEFGSRVPTPRFVCDTTARRCETADLLLSVRAPVGALNIADREYGIGRGLCAIRATSVDPRFLWWALHAARPQLAALSVGSTFDAVTADDVSGLELPTQPLPIQLAIADYLDAETARIDALIAKKQRMIELLGEQEQSLIRRELENLTDWVRLGYLMDRIIDGTHGTYERVEVGRPLLSAKNLRGGRVVVAEDESQISEADYRSIIESRRFRPGDVLLGVIGGSIGNASVLGESDPLAFQRSVAALSPGPRYSAQLLWHVVRSHGFLEQLRLASNTSAQAGVYLGDLADIRVPFGPMPVQLAAARRLSAKEERSRKVRVSLDRQLELLAERRQALITAAVTGMLEVPGVAA